MGLLLDREAEAGGAVIEKRGADPERRFVQKHAIVQPPSFERLASKALAAAQARAAGMSLFRL
ncbi:MAG TPA: hypothetical protein VLT92_10050 [Burkholderiales bacterium]|nr:hypothetical protein [Burkholderiales bacterium]